jgi:TPR repeat protein
MGRSFGAVLSPSVILTAAILIAGETHAAEAVRPSDSALDKTLPFEQLRKDAEQGNEKAEYLLGCCYNGDHGFPKDSVEAAKWWERAAAKGMADAQYCLGLSYYLGQGVLKDATAAAKWWRLAAGQEHAEAQYFLGLSYCVGRGVPKSLDLAVFWLNKSAKNGDKAAQEALGKLNPRPEGKHPVLGAIQLGR